MQLLLPVIAVVIFAVISILTGKKPSVLEKKTASSPLPSISQTETPTDTPVVSIATGNQKVSASPTPTPSQNNNPASNNFIYPGATVTSNSNETIDMTSGDDPKTITDWYKNKIQSEGMNTTSFVVTNTNGNVNNVLAGAKNNEEVKITITKTASDSVVHITVSPKSS